MSRPVGVEVDSSSTTDSGITVWDPGHMLDGYLKIPKMVVSWTLSRVLGLLE